jgi:hypothetical protein
MSYPTGNFPPAKTYELAVVGKQLPTLSQQTAAHTFNINIAITATDFKKTFFRQNAFNILENDATKIEEIVGATGDCGAVQFKHFDHAYTPDDVFNLKECILACAIDDVKAEFTPISLIQWAREINEVHYLSDLRIITSVRMKDITLNQHDELIVTSVFTSPNCQILPVILRLKYVIVEPNECDPIG